MGCLSIRYNHYQMVITMGKHAKKSLYGADILSETRKNLLLHIFQHGPASAYGTHKILNRSQSTVQTAMKELKEVGLIRLYEEKNGERGGKKILYGLTIEGFCFGFHLIARNSTTTYDVIESAIKRWKELCPEILDNWDLLIKVRRGMRPSSSDSGDNNLEWQNEQLPYQVPGIEAKYWIIFLDKVCQDRIEYHKRGGLHQFENLSPEGFTEIFIETICNLLEKRPGMFAGTQTSDMLEMERTEFFDAPYMIRVIRDIPGLWDPWLLGNLIGLKKCYEIGAISIGRLLEELGHPCDTNHVVMTVDDLDQLTQQRKEIGSSE